MFWNFAIVLSISLVLGLACSEATGVIHAILVDRGRGLRRWVVRKWKRLVVSVLLGALLLLVALNTGLNLGVTRPLLSRLISVDPQSFDLDYARAWSPFPTFVYVQGVRLRGNDANVQWQIDVEEARVTVDVLALFERQFHATKVDAKGIGLRLRQKLELAEATSDRVAPLPPIAGFGPRPLRGTRAARRVVASRSLRPMVGAPRERRGHRSADLDR